MPRPDPSDRTIAEHWATYQNFCIPRDASDAQVEATYRAFLAGSLSSLLPLRAIGRRDPEPTDAELEAMMTLLCRNFHDARALVDALMTTLEGASADARR